MGSPQPPPLIESFSAATFDPRLSWFNPPARSSIDAARSCLRLETGAKTDFWQRTHYGFRVDNGHCLLASFAGDFVLTTCVAVRPVHRYDQAGLIVRLSPDCWLKTSIEFEPNGPSRLGAVVTNHGYSDWSTQDVPATSDGRWFRIRREADDYLVEASTDGTRWSQIRMARLLEDDGSGAPVACGLYACSPTAAGFVAEFRVLSIVPGRVG